VRGNDQGTDEKPSPTPLNSQYIEEIVATIVERETHDLTLTRFLFIIAITLESGYRFPLPVTMAAFAKWSLFLAA
jgi:hypothetical protein